MARREVTERDEDEFSPDKFLKFIPKKAKIEHNACYVPPTSWNFDSG